MKSVVKSILFVSLAIVLTACGSTDKNKNNGVIVNVAKATTKQIDSKKEFSFIAQPFRSSELSFRVGGPIDNFDVYAGNHYKRGEVIAQIDPRDFRINVERTKAVFEHTKSEFERIETLYRKDNISASAYEKAKADYTSAKTAFETASNALSDTRLVAPFDGYVSEVYIEKYQDVKATQPVIAFVDISKLKIEAFVTQDIAFNSQDIKNINLRFDASPEKTYEAKIIEISKSTTKNNLSYLLTASLPNKDGKLLAGMSGKVFFEIPTMATTTVVTIPQTALCHRPIDGDYVWVVDTQTQNVRKQNVTVGNLLAGGIVSISAGLTAGEEVATSSLRFLSDGMHIEIHNKSVQ